MDAISQELRRAIESDCATGVEEVIAAHRAGDLDALRGLLEEDVAVPPAVRQNAIHILGRWGDVESAPRIRSLIASFDERERINAITALGLLGGPDGEAAVLESTDDDAPDVRRFAAYALSGLATDAARERLREMERSDPETSVRAAATRGLRRGQ